MNASLSLGRVLIIAQIGLIPSGSGGEPRERSMMGQREGGGGRFFYAFDLDQVAPPELPPSSMKTMGDTLAKSITWAWYAGG